MKSPSIASSAKLPTSASLYSNSCDPLDNGIHNACSSTGGCRRCRCAARTASLRRQLCILPFGWCKLRQREPHVTERGINILWCCLLRVVVTAPALRQPRPVPWCNENSCALKIWSSMAILCIRNYWLVRFMRHRLLYRDDIQPEATSLCEVQSTQTNWNDESGFHCASKCSVVRDIAPGRN